MSYFDTFDFNIQSDEFIPDEMENDNLEAFFDDEEEYRS